MRTLLTLLALLAVTGTIWHGVQQQRTARLVAAPLPLTFAHADHTAENCVVCHHNFTDDTGQGFCIDCHKTDPDVAALIETQFHDLCRDCHFERALAGKDHGPTRSCQHCHLPDTRP